ncbi:MAG: beta-galactosidase [Thermoguttaceae bacterium]|jgi:hypothetical protein|nr:beta-galactosidase [Thermoguttaceae bacterium]
MNRLTAIVLVFAAAVAAFVDVRTGTCAEDSLKGQAPYAAWKNGPGADPGYFPIAVWLQDPKNAAKYKAIGINVYVGLWRGPTAEQLAELKRQGMALICSQNPYALEHLDEKTIIGWMHGDEPDNAQSQGKGKGYGPPIAPEKIVAQYERLRAKDPSRPVLLNLGQGVAWDGWYGRGVRTNHPEDYPEYAKGCDIVSFDIYPAVHDRPAVAGKLWYVARGVERLRQWTAGKKVVWNCIECTHISNAKVKPTPAQVKAEVWMSIVHGSQGLIYFCHQFAPRFIEAGLLADDEMARAVGAINRQIRSLAPVINSPTIAEGVSVEVESAQADAERARALSSGPVATMVKRHDGATYVFAVRMEGTPAKARFEVRGLQGKAAAEAIGEARGLPVENGRFADLFGPYEVHLYRIAERPDRRE